MIVELHMLQNFAPANLNRDDTGAPKDCEFGGYRRARISSQCLKRAIRRAFAEPGSGLSPDELGARTRTLVREVAERLAARGRDLEQATAVVRRVVDKIPLKRDGDVTKVLIFASAGDFDVVADFCDVNWDDLSDKRKTVRDTDIKALLAHLRVNRSVDVALFGRMLAETTSVDMRLAAACHVAHAISTNALGAEVDYFTAVDDLQRPDDPAGAGAGMVGTIEFNSSCFYRYASVDLGQLNENLEDPDRERRALRAFLNASIRAIPTGKQASFAAYNPPSLISAAVRPHGRWSLANAFVGPAAPGRDEATRRTVDLIEASILKLDRYAGRLARTYGDGGVSFFTVDPGYPGVLGYLRDGRAVFDRVGDFVEAVVGAAMPTAEA